MVTAVVVVLAIGLPLVALAKTTSLIMLVAFALVNLALLRIKRRDPHPPGVRTYPAWIPWLGFLGTTGFVLFQLGDWLRS
jgi:amino acid transporter